LDGYFNILKLPGVTSHDVVNAVRKMLPGHKVGHGGTLDPGAAGVLPILIGKGTRFSSFIMEAPKVYRAELTLGRTTDTGDSFGETITLNPIPPECLEELEEVLKKYQGDIQQVPPLTSAVKHKGKKLYQYARQGEHVESPPRRVHILSLKAAAIFPPERVLLEVRCSKGTYIRALCLDLGEDLGCGGHMSFLLRKEAGGFTLNDAVTLDELNLQHENGRLDLLLHPLDHPFRCYTSLVMHQNPLKRLCHGEMLGSKDLPEEILKNALRETGQTYFPVYNEQGEFFLLACCKKDRHGVLLKPEKVIKQPAN